ncbi:MAG: hypothetical protein ACI4VL_02305 [Bacilli bacterium]
MKYKYFEILYQNCFDKKYVALKCARNIEEIMKNIPSSCKILDYKETTQENMRYNKIIYFTDYSFSV